MLLEQTVKPVMNAPAKAPKSAITVTAKAAEHIKSLLSNSDQSYLGIRIGIKSGGCSKFSYYIEYALEKNKFDELIHDQGVNILIDPKALLHLIGTEMDYAEDKFKSGFTFSNPNEKDTCGCGKSFST